MSDDRTLTPAEANSALAQVRPLVERMVARGDHVEITARDYAQTLQLIEQHGMQATVIGQHGGRSRTGKARQMVARLQALHSWARGREFDIALAHGSHELTLTARRLGIPSATTFDYEWAWLQHQLGCRAATRVVVPASIPEERWRRYGVHRPKLATYEGLKEEYYLAGFEPNAAVLDELAIDRARILVVLRPPPEVSLYHRHGNPLFLETLRRIGSRGDAHAVVIPRTEEQRDFIRSLDLPSAIVPERAVDAQSLIAFSDLVVSAGGTMNREAVALGAPGGDLVGHLLCCPTDGGDREAVGDQVVPGEAVCHLFEVACPPHLGDIRGQDHLHRPLLTRYGRRSPGQGYPRGSRVSRVDSRTPTPLTGNICSMTLAVPNRCSIGATPPGGRRRRSWQCSRSSP